MDVLITKVPDKEMGVDVQPNVNENKFKDGYQQTVAMGVFNKPRTMSPRWSNMDYAAAKALISFLENLKGYKKFLWAGPEEPQRVFKCPRLNYKWKNGRKCDISATFEEQGG